MRRKHPCRNKTGDALTVSYEKMQGNYTDGQTTFVQSIRMKRSIHLFGTVFRLD